MSLQKNLAAITPKNLLLNLGIVLSVGLVNTGTFPLNSWATETPKTEQKSLLANSGILPLSNTKQDNSLGSIPDGVYLYGNTSEADQIGNEYLVFEVRDGKTIGAFYQPRSEYACFYGAIAPEQMNLSVVDPYEEAVYSHSIALQEVPSTIATANGQAPRTVALEGYKRISNISDNDERMLNTCINNYQEVVWE
ncbi:hypothetical protein [Oscillatoria salina]|uniref:hypothetical protein n=1 Tax=Oscillatoria salina TaxID=331517 RepID=UPI001CCB13B6|nr:hypothetical protein [Oscillatoria salina]MBZ8180676.1 hypothetical protein [Oscillatoria salina IIICB1]